MKEYKLNIDRKMPEDANIDKHKDFAKLLAQMPKTPPVEGTKPSFTRRYGQYIAGLAIVLIGVGIWFSQTNENTEKTTTLADTTAQVAVNEPKKEESPVIVAAKKEIPLETPKPVSPKIEKETKEKQAEKQPEKTVEKVVEKMPVAEVATPVETPAKAVKSTLVEPQKPKGKTLAFKADVSRFPELSAYEGIQWEYIGTSDAENPYKNGVLNVKNTWKSVEVQKKDANSYLLVLTDKAGKTFSFPARPVFKDKEYEEAMKVYQAKSWE